MFFTLVYGNFFNAKAPCHEYKPRTISGKQKLETTSSTHIQLTTDVSSSYVFLFQVKNSISHLCWLRHCCMFSLLCFVYYQASVCQLSYFNMCGVPLPELPSLKKDLPTQSPALQLHATSRQQCPHPLT